MSQTVPARLLTVKGERSRAKIVETAATLMLTDGVAGTTIEGVCSAAGVGRSQVYHYFEDKSALVRAVIERQAELIFGGQDPYLAHIQGWESWEAWRDFVIETQRRAGCVGGCPLGSLASELADDDELTRHVLLKSFKRWERALRGGVQQMTDLGLLRQDADPVHLATTLLAALQGGLLLCQTWKDVSPLETSLNGAIGYLRTFAV
ncbi:MAG TPA: TetR/AcrR family transcriptional regulator [Terrimesophilobacter sp.]|nr:TetR/AcrR family transcriptional regulator [Terrimesophilobacter sp.]